MEFFNFIAVLFEHLTFARLLLLSGLLLCMSLFFNAHKLAALVNAITRLLRRR